MISYFLSIGDGVGRGVIFIVNCLFQVLLTRLFHSVHRPFVRSDLGHLVLSPRSAHHSVCCHLLWVWLCGVDASDPVCLHPSLQLWRTHVAYSFQQARVHLYNLKLVFTFKVSPFYNSLGSLPRHCQSPTRDLMVCCHLLSSVLQNALFGMVKSQL